MHEEEVDSPIEATWVPIFSTVYEAYGVLLRRIYFNQAVINQVHTLGPVQIGRNSHCLRRIECQAFFRNGSTMALELRFPCLLTRWGKLSLRYALRSSLQQPAATSIPHWEETLAFRYQCQDRPGYMISPCTQAPIGAPITTAVVPTSPSLHRGQSVCTDPSRASTSLMFCSEISGP